MILTAALLFQVVAASASAGSVHQGGEELVVRDAARTMHVPIAATAAGPMIRLDGLEPIVDASVRRVAPGEYDARVFGVGMHFEVDVAVVKVASQVHPLAAAPAVRDGHLLVPLQFVSEVLPTIAPNLRWDAAKRQLVVFSMPASHERGSRVAAGDDPPAPRESSDGAHESSASTAAGAHRHRGPYTVVVDAGHGGPDNGMTGPIGGGPKVYEKNITLAVAKKLGATLADDGVHVVYTRTTDTLIALDDRGKIANKANGDLFVSIHVNAANPNWKDPGAARGFETYFLAEARTEDARRVEQMENDAVRFENTPSTSSKNDPLSFIFSDMLQNEHLRESSDLAAIIQRHLANVEPGPSRGVKQAGFRVLVTAYMPAVLVEIGFGTNPAEAQFLTTPSRQQKIANAVAAGVLEYLHRYERRVSGSGR